MVTITVSTKGQIAIPRSVRDRLSLKPGTKLGLDVKGETLVMRRVAAGLKDWRSMQGMIRKGPSLTQALEEEHRREMEREDARNKGL